MLACLLLACASESAVAADLPWEQQPSRNSCSHKHYDDDGGDGGGDDGGDDDGDGDDDDDDEQTHRGSSIQVVCNSCSQ